MSGDSKRFMFRALAAAMAVSCSLPFSVTGCVLGMTPENDDNGDKNDDKDDNFVDVVPVTPALGDDNTSEIEYNPGPDGWVDGV